MTSQTSECSYDIVIVDDDVLTLERLKRLLQGVNCNLHCFSDARVAIGYMQDNDASILIVDQRMPHMKGIDLLTKLQNLNRVGRTDLYLYSATEIPDEVCRAAIKSGIQTLSKDLLVNRDDFVRLLTRAG